MIIKPQGKPIRRITIEMDTKGQAKCEAINTEFAPGAPMAITEVALILGQVLTTVIQTLHNAQPFNNPLVQRPNDAKQATAQENHNDV